MKEHGADIEEFYKVISSPLPSKNLASKWMPHHSNVDYPEHTEKGGKWIISCPKEHIDDFWEKVKAAQDDGKLGRMSKVSTLSQTIARNMQRGGGSHVVCVYTYDSEDLEDVLRIRDSLKEIGLKKQIPYKRDIETNNGVYGTADEFLFVV